MSFALANVSQTVCPVCGSEASSILENIDIEAQHRLYAPGDIVSQHRLTGMLEVPNGRYHMRKCAVCSLEYADPCISPGSDWYSLTYSLLPLYPSIRWEFDYVLSQIERSSIIGEIGCGSGEFLWRCQQRNIVSWGLDFSVDAVECCQQKGLDAYRIDVDRETFLPQKPCNVVVAFHVLEHLPQPQLLFETASMIAGDSAELWVAVPSDLRPTRILKEGDFLDQPPHHMTRWNPVSLKRSGQNAGWVLKECVYEPLPYKAALWWYATKNAFYQRMKEQNRLQSVHTERLVRLMNYPQAIRRQISAQPKMTGFTILARYER